MRKAIILSLAASLLLSSCAAVEDIKRLTADDSSYSQTEDARQDAEQTAENDPTQSGAASKPSRPKKAADDEFSVPEHDPIPAVPDVSAGTPDDGIMPIELTDDTGYTDEYGIFHVSCEGACTRHEYTRAILSLTGYDKDLVSAAYENNQGAVTTTLLENLMMKMTGLYEMPDWREELKRYIEKHNLGKGN